MSAVLYAVGGIACMVGMHAFLLDTRYDDSLRIWAVQLLRCLIAGAFMFVGGALFAAAWLAP